jgi:hypothetical protein
MQARVAPTRRKETHRATIAVIRRKVVARIRRPHEPILLRAAATAVVAPLIPAVGEVHPTAVEVVELPMAVAAVLTAIVNISDISAFQKGPPLSNAAGLLLSRSLQS